MRVAVVGRLVLRLWRDSRGESSFLGLILLAAIAAIGIIVGLVSVRDAIVQEFGDVAVALDRLDQSYDILVINQCTGAGTELWTCSYKDDGLTGHILLDEPGAPPTCLDLSQAPTAEGDDLPALGGGLGGFIP